MRKLKTTVAAAALLLGYTASANAFPGGVYISLQSADVNAGLPTEVASGTDAIAWFGTYGNAIVNNVALTNITDLLSSHAIDVFTENAGVLTILFSSTDQNITAGGVSSHFTSNVLKTGYNLNIKTYLAASNLPYDQDTLIGDATFTTIGTDEDLYTAGPCTDCSFTAVYTITHPATPGTTVSNAVISQVFEPSSMLMLFGGLLTMAGLFPWARRRNS